MSFFRRRDAVPAQGALPEPPRARPSSQSPVNPLGFAVVDIETTGLSPHHDRILEIAVVQTDIWGRPQREWATRINPQRSVGATHIHGIREQDVASAPTFTDVLPTLLRLLRGRALVAHNARFDSVFLAHEFGRQEWAWPTIPTLCTMQESTHFLPMLERRRLADCCWACGFNVDHAHSALGDARATARLVQWYFDPRLGPQPLAHHRQLVVRGAHLMWPAAPGTVTPDAPTIWKPRAHAEDLGPLTPSGPPRWMSQKSVRVPTLLETIDVAALVPRRRTDLVPYLELVIEAISDGVLSESERTALDDVAESYDLCTDEREGVHEALLRQLARQAVQDGTVTKAERAELTQVAELLGITPELTKRALSDELGALQEERSKELRPLPEDWTHGTPLRLGDRVVFTGECDGEREALEHLARDAGLRVTGSVSKLTALLVTTGDIDSNKVKRAHELGTRVESPHVFKVLLEHRQPAEQNLPVRTELPKRAAGQDSPEPAGMSESTPADPSDREQRPDPRPNPADVRKWALENGYDVGVRGRISQSLFDAYLRREQ